MGDKKTILIRKVKQGKFPKLHTPGFLKSSPRNPIFGTTKAIKGGFKDLKKEIKPTIELIKGKRKSIYDKYKYRTPKLFGD